MKHKIKEIWAARRRYSVTAVVPIVVVLIWLGSSGRETHEEIDAASRRAAQVAAVRATIVDLNEWLAVVAQIGASTGEHRWADRYEEVAPKLDTAIAEATNLAMPEARAVLAGTLGEAHRNLAVMERHALALAAAGGIPAARHLLDGAGYAYLQIVYANGADVFGRELTAVSGRQIAALDARTWLETAGLGVSAILLGATILSVRGHRRLQGALAHTASVARTDALTELPNRRQLYEEIEKALAAGHRTGLDHALMLIDLDRFKAANDAFGHLAGDELLRLVAARLRETLRDDNRIARLGGDEFAFLVRCDPSGPDQPITDPVSVAERVVAAMAKPFSLAGGIVVQIGASIGIGLTDADTLAVSDLMHRADVALYRAKADGRGCARAFEPGMDAHVRARALLESELRQAVADGAIVPHFQPLVDIGDGRLVGVEMLARWNHPTRGMVPPSEFIPIVEELDLIGTLTAQLLRRACLAAVDWPDHVTLACNVSPLHLRDPHLPAMIRATLSETGFPARRLELEVTESALVGDLALARALLDQLKVLGVRLALDDFGTGYSSLRHLQHLPFDKIKIDRSFVGAMSDDEESGKIVSAVIGLGHSLGLLTVAEGVETPEAARLLRDLGCDVGQGWLFGRPAAAERIDDLLAEQEAGPASLSLVA